MTTAGPMPSPLFVGGPAGGGGAPGLGIPIVATEAAASAYAGLLDGQFIYVQSEGSLWVSDPGSAIPLAANEVIARAGGGRLIRTDYADPRWAKSITDVYVSDAGSAENEGIYTSTPGVPAPITPRELRRRWQGQTVTVGDLINFTLRIHIVGTATGFDLRDVKFGADCFPQVIGEAPTVVRAGTLNAVAGFVAQVPTAAGGGTACIVNDPLFDLGTLVGKRIRFTATGAIATILKSLGANNARISQPNNDNFAAFGVFPTAVNPANGAAYVVEDLTSVHLDGNLTVQPSVGVVFSAFSQFLALKDLDINTRVAGAMWSPHADMQVVAYSCVTHCFIDLGRSLDLDNCTIRQLVGATDPAGSDLPNFNFAGIFGGGYIADPGAGAFLSLSGMGGGAGVVDFHFTVQGACILFNGNATHGTVAVFDAPIAAIVNPGGHAILVGNIASGRTFSCQLQSRAIAWGNGSAGVGMRIARNSNVQYRVLPNIVGGGGDFTLGGAAAAWWFDAGIYNPVGAGIATTWANLAAARPGGFDNRAHNPDGNASIVLSPAS